MGKIKKLIFSLFLIGFQNIHTMEEEETHTFLKGFPNYRANSYTSEEYKTMEDNRMKARAITKYVEGYMNEDEYDTSNTKAKIEILTFYGKFPNSIPYITYESSDNFSVWKILGAIGFLEKTLLGYFWGEYETAWAYQKLEKKEVSLNWRPRAREIKNEAIRNAIENFDYSKIKIPENVEIVIKEQVVITDLNQLPDTVVTKPGVCIIELAPGVKEHVEDRIAESLAKAERGDWDPKRNLIYTKIFLGLAGFVVPYCKDKGFTWAGLGCLGGIVVANYFKEFFERREKEACRKHAKELFEFYKKAIFCPKILPNECTANVQDSKDRGTLTAFAVEYKWEEE